MDEYDSLDGDCTLFAPIAETARRLAVLTLEEAHDLLALLVAHRAGARQRARRSSVPCAVTGRQGPGASDEGVS
ncbi:DUF6417 family protein [Streptomyces sp. NPDC002265]|uniref:DUF6417 family protein n=1 Tax=Streptomyces sp. NPDC002265 TaxID=3154415 RepID=UPI003316CFC5